jgi:microcystin degradation protein MlrC
MAINWKQLAQAVLTGTATAIYTAPSNTQTAVHTAQVWNPTGSAVVVDVFSVPVAGSAVDGTHIDRVQVPAASASAVYGLINHKLSAGMQVFASGNGVTLTISGAESA